MALRSIINFVLFQGVWFSALLLERDAVIPASFIICLMLFLSEQRKQDIQLLACGLPIALGYEWLASGFELINYKVSPLPLWLAFLWAALLLTINTSMQFLQKLPWYFAWLVCLAFAPASYYAGIRFGVLSTDLTVVSFWLYYGLGWATMFVCIITFNKRFFSR